MFETGQATMQYEDTEYGRRRRRRRRIWDDDDESAGYGVGEQEGYAGEYGQGAGYGSREGEYAGYGGQGEYPAYGSYEGEGYGQYGETSYEDEAGGPSYESDGEGESDEGEEGEEQFFPLIPIAGKVLGGLLGGLLKEIEGEETGEVGDSELDEGEEEVGEAEEELLGKILKSVLGREAEFAQPVLSAEQEAELAAQMLEIADERELDHFLGNIVNAIGRVVQGVSGAARSPQGRALIDAVKPLARAALPAVGGAIGTAFAPGIGTQVGRTLGSAASSLFELDSEGLEPEQEQFEVARRVVRLTAAAAQDAAGAPPGAPGQLVGELSVVGASRRFAPRAFRRALRSIAPLARRGRFYGRYGGYRRGYGAPYRYPYRRGYRPYGRPYRRFGYPGPYAAALPVPYPAPEPEPVPSEPPPMPPVQPGFRWVAVPIGAPTPTAPPAGPEPEPPAPPDAAPAGQSEFGYGRYRRRGSGYGRGNGYGRGYGYDGGRRGYDDDGRSGGGRGTAPAGRWIRRNGKIIVLDA